MKIRRKNQEGESRELILKEYFLNAYLIALLKQVGGQTKQRLARDNAEAAKAAASHN